MLPGPGLAWRAELRRGHGWNLRPVGPAYAVSGRPGRLAGRDSAKEDEAMSPDTRLAAGWNPAERAWETSRRGYSVFSDPVLNKGTAFNDSERAALGLTGLLPSRVLTLDQQAERAYRQCSQQPSALD